MKIRLSMCCLSIFAVFSSLVFSAGAGAASEFEPLGTDSMRVVAPEEREGYLLGESDIDAGIGGEDSGWKQRSVDGDRGNRNEGLSGEVDEGAVQRLVPTVLGSDLVIVSADEMGLVEQMMKDAYASGPPRGHVEEGKMWSDRVDLSVVPELAVNKGKADEAEMAVAVAREERRACQTLWPSGIEICGAILDKYRQLGWPANWLGWPTEPESVNPDGQGYRQRFATGFIYWHPATGAHAVPNVTVATWERNGFEAGWLGYPTSDERAVTGQVGPGVVEAYGGVQDSQGGQIYRGPVARGAKSAAVTGAILDRWKAIGGTGSALGFPTRDEAKTPDGVGRFSEFEAGSVYWSPATGAWEVPVGILQKWATEGFERGRLGYPIGAPQSDGVYRMTQQFEHGTITGYDARIVLLGNLLQLSPEELDEAYTTLMTAFIKDGKDPAQGFVDVINHAIQSYNTTLRLNNGEHLEDRSVTPGLLPPVSVIDYYLSNPVPEVIYDSDPKSCEYVSPGNEETRQGDVFYSTAYRVIKGKSFNHGHAGMFVSGYIPNENPLKSGAITVEAVNQQRGVEKLHPADRSGVCRPILMHVKADATVQRRAVEFALSKDRKAGYNNLFLITRLWPYDADSYNCSQLVWAAYMKASNGRVNIGKAYPLQPPQYGIYPSDILFSYLTTAYAQQ